MELCAVLQDPSLMAYTKDEEQNFRSQVPLDNYA